MEAATKTMPGMVPGVAFADCGAGWGTAGLGTAPARMSSGRVTNAASGRSRACMAGVVLGRRRVFLRNEYTRTREVGDKISARQTACLRLARSKSRET